MKHTFSLVLAVLLVVTLFPSCSLFQKDESYHWTPPEKKTASYDVPPYDPASGMTYEEYLTTLDVPIVVSFTGLNGPEPLIYLHDALGLTKNNINNILQLPHVVGISYPLLLHWLGDSLTSSILMIGQSQAAPEPAQIGEGRLWSAPMECCVNRALYEKLLSDPDTEFGGLGDSVTIMDRFFYRGFLHMEDGSRKEILQLDDATEISFTVTGIVDDEREFANTDAYGFYHLYTFFDTVQSVVSKFDYNHPDWNDEDVYLYKQIAEACIGPQTQLFYRTSAQDPTKKEICLPDGTILPEEQWLANFENVPVNAGYTVEVTLDSGTGYAEFLETVWDRPSARKIYDNIKENYEKTNNPINNPLNMPMRVPQNLQEILDAGELDEWYSYPTAPMIARPLRIAS